MKIKLSQTLMMGAITALLSTSYASAGTINAKVQNTGNPVPTMEVLYHGQSWPFPGSDGQHDVPVADAVYSGIIIGTQGVTPVAFCKASSLPGAPNLTNVDLDGPHKKFSVVVEYNAAHHSLACYAAGG